MCYIHSQTQHIPGDDLEYQTHEISNHTIHQSGINCISHLRVCRYELSTILPAGTKLRDDLACSELIVTGGDDNNIILSVMLLSLQCDEGNRRYPNVEIIHLAEMAAHCAQITGKTKRIL